MIAPEVVIEGTLKPDGTLELDRRPDLPPGRVRVTLRQPEAPAPPPGEDWFQFLLRSRRELEASGARFMTDSEVEDHIRWLREDDSTDERLQSSEPAG